jgi:hypothetical protein
MSSKLFNDLFCGFRSTWLSLSKTSKTLVLYGVLMWLLFGLALLLSLADTRTIRDIGVWIKPMKFMASTSLFAWTMVWVTRLADNSITFSHSFKLIASLLIATSFFEVAYITYQAQFGEASHYNRTDLKHTLLFGLMAFAAVGLTASQGWLALVIWLNQRSKVMSVTTLSVVVGLTLTFLLATISGFLLGSSQPPAGQGLPFFGWHLRGDIRPAHFLGVHAQQLVPMVGLFANHFVKSFSKIFLITSSIFYVLAWLILTVMGSSS